MVIAISERTGMLLFACDDNRKARYIEYLRLKNFDSWTHFISFGDNQTEILKTIISDIKGLDKT